MHFVRPLAAPAVVARWPPGITPAGVVSMGTVSLSARSSPLGRTQSTCDPIRMLLPRRTAGTGAKCEGFVHVRRSFGLQTSSTRTVFGAGRAVSITTSRRREDTPTRLTLAADLGDAVDGA